MIMNKRAEAVQQERRRRREHSPSGFSQKFAIPDHLRDDANYRYHWVLDEPGRVAELQGQDWDFVDIPQMAGDELQKGSGTRLERHGMRSEEGHSIRHVAMRKLRKFDEEDTAREAEINEGRMAAIQRGQVVSATETVAPAPGTRTYTPDGGITITRA